MVANIGRVPSPLNGRIGLAGGRPLAERYESAKAMAIREIPEGEPEREGVFSLMVSEQSIDVFFDLVRQFKTRTAANDDPKLRPASMARPAHQHRPRADLAIRVGENMRGDPWPRSS
jgi:hypothetical protein